MVKYFFIIILKIMINLDQITVTARTILLMMSCGPALICFRQGMSMQYTQKPCLHRAI